MLWYFFLWFIIKFKKNKIKKLDNKSKIILFIKIDSNVIS